MTEFLVVLAFILFCSLAIWMHCSESQASRTPPESVDTEFLLADCGITSEFNRARHAMNDAAGQSWRNLAG